MWVFDATPLIYLARVESLDLLAELDGSRRVPALVHDEVVERGVEAGYPDARRVERAVDDGLFDVDDVEGVDATDQFDRLSTNDRLSDADAAVLAQAAVADSVAVMDEAYGRDVAAAEGIETRGTAYLVLSLVQRDALDASAAREVIDGMLDAGWYCAPDLYARIVRRLDGLADDTGT